MTRAIAPDADSDTLSSVLRECGGRMEAFWFCLRLGFSDGLRSLVASANVSVRIMRLRSAHAEPARCLVESYQAGA